MIQKLVLSALLLGAAGATQAQNRSLKMLHLNPQQQKQLNLVNSLVQKNPRSGVVAHKPTAIKQRVVAQVYLEEGYSDSLRYHYTGTNGSQYNFSNFGDPGYSYSFWPDAAPAYTGFDEYLPSTDVKADSITSFADDELYLKNIAYYNTAGLLDSTIESGVPSGLLGKKVLVTRSTTGLVTGLDRINLPGGALETGERRRVSHNTSGQVVTDSTYYMSSGTSWVYSDNRLYHYNSSGQLDTMTESSPVANKTRYIFSYDGSGRISTVETYSLMDGVTAILQTKDTIGYAAGRDYITLYQSIYYSGMGMNDGFRVVQHPGDHPGPDSATVQFFEDDEWNTLGTLFYTYNTQGNPALLVGVSVDPDEEDIFMKFYYEDYDDGLSNKDVFLNKDFAVFPNPFTNNISIDYKGKEQKNVAVSLVDITGRNVFQSNINLQSGSNNIPVADLSAGTYILQIEGKAGKLYSNKLIKK